MCIFGFEIIEVNIWTLPYFSTTSHACLSMLLSFFRVVSTEAGQSGGLNLVVGGGWDGSGWLTRRQVGALGVRVALEAVLLQLLARLGRSSHRDQRWRHVARLQLGMR